MLQEFSIVRARTEGYKELAYPLGKKKPERVSLHWRLPWPRRDSQQSFGATA